MPPIERSDFLVIGSGIAGLCFALETAERGDVTILTKKEDFESNTNYAQGGIACVATAEDSFESHIEDTIEAGAGLCHEEVVRDLVTEGPELVHQLIDWGVRFTTKGQSAQGRHELKFYDLGREGGHSERRILHAKDLTGREVERALLTCLREHPRVRFLEHHVAIDLLDSRNAKGERRCVGALAMDSNGDRLEAHVAPVVLLATGGVGQIYRHTTNPAIATGDGIAMAWRLGLPVANLEFIQFHPTAFYSNTGKTFLISEAVRGEGAILKRKNGEPFMDQYHRRADLAPRDVVARAIDTEMKRRGDNHALLDCSSMDEAFFADRFPEIRRLCGERGIEPPGDSIPVVPSAHYSCGGVVTDREGKTKTPGLYVTGECACTGTHGANRLASNSLLEALVFSHRAAQSAMGSKPGDPIGEPILPDWATNWRAGTELEGVRVEHCRDELRRLMWDYVGIVRKNDRLLLAGQRLRVLRDEVEGYWAAGAINPATIELRNMIQTAELVVRCALSRKESRGLHFTLDYPDPVDSDALDTILTPEEEG